MKIKLNIFSSILILLVTVQTYSQVQSTEKRYVRIGELQSHFSAYGSERAWNNSYYEGLRWPAEYSFSDNAVIKRFWIGVDDFTDVYGKNWEKFALYLSADYVGNSIFPVELKQTAKFKPPQVIVDEVNISNRYLTDIDEYNSEQIPDRIVTNVLNTKIGLTIKREVWAFSQQYHDNYFIKIYTYTNTGNIDYDDEIELNAPLKDIRISWGTRYSVSRDGAFYIDGAQQWGKHSWVTKRGENYADHVNETLSEDNPIVDWLRCGFSWAGQSSTNSFDNIGGPDVSGNGRLSAPQFAGVAILHVDKSATDQSDDPNQPLVLGWHAGDTYPSLGDGQNVAPMIQVYNMISGNPYKGLGGNERFYETNSDGITHKLDPFSIHNDGGGTNLWVAYSPFTLQPGESIVIVEAEGVDGLNREMCDSIGGIWKAAYEDNSDNGPFDLPDGTSTNSEDIYKNTWVYTGVDSILQTFGRAKRNFDSGFNIPEAPLPPELFNVTSGGDKISLTWGASPSESESNFDGYRIFRAKGKPDTTYERIYKGPPGVYSFDDESALRGFSYYYYISSVSNGSNNSTGETNPTGELLSSKFYTRTTEPAYLRRKPGTNLDMIRVVPNPYNIRAKELQFTGESDKIMFYDIPGYCEIRIYTERGDLVDKIIHDNGSGDQAWNSLSTYRQVVVSGVYLAHFTVTEDQKDPDTGEVLYSKGDTAIRKFIIIR